MITILSKGYFPARLEIDEDLYIKDDALLLTDSIEVYDNFSHSKLLNCSYVDLRRGDYLSDIVVHIEKRKCKTLIIAAGNADVLPDSADRVMLNAKFYYCVAKEIVNYNNIKNIINVSTAHSTIPALLSGMIKCVAIENGGIRLISIRADIIDNNSVHIALCSLKQSFSDMEIRRGKVFVAGWRQTLSDVGGGRIRRGGRYIVAGGAGGVGKSLCRYLRDQFNADIFVISRSKPSHSTKNALIDAGVKAYLEADITDIYSFGQAWDYVSAAHGHIDGVFHLAGVLNDRLFVNKSEDEFNRTLAPKVTGLLHIDHFARRDGAELVVSFSSLSGLVGNVGQADYSAANAFLDAFAEVAGKIAPDRPRHVSIAWGLWESDGMQMTGDFSGLLPMEPEQALDRMAAVIEGSSTLAAVYAGSAPMLEGTAAADARATASTIAPPPIAAVVEWLDALAERFAKLGGIDPGASLVEHGLTSSAAISIASHIEATLRQVDPEFALTKAIVFSHPSLAALATHLLSHAGHALALKFASAAEPPAQPEDPETLEDVRPRAIAWLQELVARFTRLTDLTTDDNLIAAGVDSVAAINISSEIQRRLARNKAEVTISKAIVFNHPSIGAVTDYLLEVHRSEMLAELCSSGAPPMVEVPASARGAAVSASLVSSPVGRSPSPPVRTEDIAIIGMAGEFPGAENEDALWELLAAGRSAITPIPADRWDWKGDYHPDKKVPGRSYSRHGGFVRHAKAFDPQFFNIAPVEAERMDPQERRLLHLSYHALEDAGFFAQPMTDVGVFAAAMFGHYQDLDAPEAAFGSSFSAIANRLSYFFDFHGPSLCVDTMCSGSLTALHLAVAALRRGECRLAVVGASNIIVHPGKYRLLSEGRFLSPTGRCHSFGVEADGYVPGEGTVAVVLKRAADAIADDDRIHGFVCGSAVNAVGRSSGFTVPSAQAQAEVIRRAVADAGVLFSDVSYVEAHGTGTGLGDPIEIEGLVASYGKGGNATCAIGSVKSNIGHLEPVAGLAGLVKVLLQMRHGELVPTLSCEIENPYLNLGATPFSLQKTQQAWLLGSVRRFAGLSSFGAGGANAHVVVGDYTAPAVPDYVHSRAPLPFPVSAKTPTAMRQRLEDLRNWMAATPAIDLYRLGYTLSCARAHFKLRECLVADSRETLLTAIDEALSRWSLGGAVGQDIAPLVVTGAASVDEERRRYLRGETAHWGRCYPVRRMLSVPRYPFSTQEYWVENFGRRKASAHNSNSAAPILPAEGPRASTDQDDDALVFLKPVWTQQDPPHFPGAGARMRTVVLCSSEQASRLPDFLHDAETVVMDAVQQGQAEWLGRGTSLRVVNLWSLSPEATRGAPAAVGRKLFDLAKVFASAGRQIDYYHLYASDVDGLAARYGGAYGNLFHALAKENLAVSTTLVEIGGNIENALDLDALRTETLAASAEFRHVRYLGARRHVLTYAESSLGGSDGSRLRERGVYVIAGGMGKLGLAVAESLVTRRNARVALLGRSPLDAERRAILDRLNRLGGTADYYALDIADADAVRRCTDDIVAAHGALHGVIQSAGRIDDRLFAAKEWRDFNSIVETKALGAHNLDMATSRLPLDFFVMFSSIASTFGNAGQADYMVGNAFLDQFAAARNRWVAEAKRSGVTMSINWPLWQDGGMDMDDAKQDFIFETFGLRALSNGEGVDTLERLIDLGSAGPDQIVVLKGRRRKLLTSFAGPAGAPAQDSTSASPEADVATIERITALIGAVVKLPAAEIGQATNLGDLGFNSVLLQQLADSIHAACGIGLPASAFFTHNTASKIAAYVDERQPSRRSAPAVAVAVPAPQSALARDAAVPVEDGAIRYAIIGIDGRMPGGDDLDDFWKLLVENRSAIRHMDRGYGLQHLGGLLPDIDRFDAKFFNLSNREAMLMDPQHRLFLQSAYNALLNAGYSPRSLSDVGVFVGVQFSDYQTLLQQWQRSRHPYAATGNAHAMLANRLSYMMDFKGPSQSIDTACSSALIALNRAMMSLDRGECDYALAGAVSLLIDPVVTDAARSMGVLSPNHRCATFDTAADGYVRGEGVGCVVIKRYKDALRDGDAIHAVILSGAENHGGRAHSLTAPNPEAQTRLLLKAYDASLARQVSYIEVHGTGTKLGDPIEIDALKEAWRQLAPDHARCSIHLGAVKTNVGHLEPAAGMASLLTVLLALRHRILPANLHFNQLNPRIDIEGSCFAILDRNREWKAPRLVAGVSSFGFGGSNAHVVVAEPPARSARSARRKPAYLITLSARSRISLSTMLDRLTRHVAGMTEDASDEIANLAFTLSAGREHFEFRLAWLASSLEDLVAQLRETDIGDVVQVKPGGAIDLPSPDASAPHYLEQLRIWRERYLRGAALDWARLHQDAPCQRLHIPGYSFDVQPYWFEEAADTQLMKAL